VSPRGSILAPAAITPGITDWRDAGFCAAPSVATSSFASIERDVAVRDIRTSPQNAAAQFPPDGTALPIVAGSPLWRVATVALAAYVALAFVADASAKRTRR
jgi:hypothetical protein